MKNVPFGNDPASNAVRDEELAWVEDDIASDARNESSLEQD
jgi:hypothetical protein